MKQCAVIPIYTLLRNKLLDYYLDLNNNRKGSMGAIMKVLAGRAGLSANWLMGAAKFMNRSQGTPKSINNYLADFKKLFKRAYIPYREFRLHGTSTEVSNWAVSLKGRPITLDEAVKSAQKTENALEFDSWNQSVPVHVVQQRDGSLLHLQQTVTDLSLYQVCSLALHQL